MGFVGLKPKEMPDHPDLVLYRMSAPDVWGLYLVRPYERAVFIENGKVTRVLEGGRHSVARMPVIGVVDVVWVRLKDMQLRFYAAALSRETVPIKMWGFAVMKVADVLSFVLHVVDGKKVYTQDALDDWLRGQYVSVVRSYVGRSTYDDYVTDRKQFLEMMRAETNQVMNEYGLSITTVEVEKIEVPPDIIVTKKEKVKAPDVAATLTTKSGAVAQMYKAIIDAGVNPTTLEFLKTMTGRDVSEVLVSLGTTPSELGAKMSAQTHATPGIANMVGTGAGPMDMVFTMFAMQMMQQMIGTQTAAGAPGAAPRPGVTASAQQCQNCGNALPPAAKFCPGCSSPVVAARHCTYCGTSVPDAAKFCPSCGKAQR